MAHGFSRWLASSGKKENGRGAWWKQTCSIYGSQEADRERRSHKKIYFSKPQNQWLTSNHVPPPTREFSSWAHQGIPSVMSVVPHDPIILQKHEKWEERLSVKKLNTGKMSISIGAKEHSLQEGPSPLHWSFPAQPRTCRMGKQKASPTGLWVWGGL